MSDKLVLGCKCHTTSHNVVVHSDAWDINDKDLTIYAAMNHCLPWHKRLVVAIKYLFGMDNTYDHYADVLIKDEDIEKLKQLIAKHQSK